MLMEKPLRLSGFYSSEITEHCGLIRGTLATYVGFMKRDEAISRLQQHEAELKRLGVEHL
jgi:hypothetical protein